MNWKDRIIIIHLPDLLLRTMISHLLVIFPSSLSISQYSALWAIQWTNSPTRFFLNVGWSVGGHSAVVSRSVGRYQNVCFRFHVWFSYIFQIQDGGELERMFIPMHILPIWTHCFPVTPPPRERLFRNRRQIHQSLFYSNLTIFVDEWVCFRSLQSKSISSWFLLDLHYAIVVNWILQTHMCCSC